ncbi:hypothetical protein [Photobacterium damselae]|uniref:hypothetical protein n=1 Tax=Photobacterium damselae TaxID=38293 RepID=UPI001F1917B4|nr:hypothetical protein [Photobacterium damselae]UKA04921.1 hypothetical protein IHC89_22005 [Photobacterium damselae subsp. damselae]
MAYITVTTPTESFTFNVLNNFKEFSLTLWEYSSSTGANWQSVDGFNASNIKREDIVIPSSVKQEAIAEFTKKVVFN